MAIPRRGKLSRRLLWADLRSALAAPQLTAAVLALLVDNLPLVLAHCDHEDIQSVVFPFALKCLACGHPPTQKIALARLGQLGSEAPPPAALAARLLPLLRGRADLALPALRLLRPRLSSLDPADFRRVFEQLRPPMNEAPPVLADQAVKTLADILQLQEINNFADIGQNELLVAFADALSESKLSSEGFDLAAEAVDRIMKRIRERRARLPQPMNDTPEELPNSLNTLFDSVEITTPDIADILGGKHTQYNPEAVESNGTQPASFDFDFSSTQSVTPQPSTPQRLNPQPLNAQPSIDLLSSSSLNRPSSPTKQPPPFIMNLRKGPANSSNFNLLNDLNSAPVIKLKKDAKKETLNKYFEPVNPSTPNDEDLI